MPAPSLADLRKARWAVKQAPPGLHKTAARHAYYKLNQEFFKAAPKGPKPVKALKQEVQEAVKQALPEIGERPLSDNEWKIAHGTIIERVWARLKARLAAILGHSFDQGVADSRNSEPQGVGQKHDLARALINGTYKAFSEEASKRLNAIMHDAFDTEHTGTEEVLGRMVTELGADMTSHLERITRTETIRVRNTGKMLGYRDRERASNLEFLFAYGPVLGTTPRGYPECKGCLEVTQRTKDGVPMDRLIAIIEEVARKEYAKWMPGPQGSFPIMHPNCRHSFRLTGKQPISVRKADFIAKQWILQPSRRARPGSRWHRYYNTATGEVRYETHMPGTTAPASAPPPAGGHEGNDKEYADLVASIRQRYVDRSKRFADVLGREMVYGPVDGRSLPDDLTQEEIRRLMEHIEMTVPAKIPTRGPAPAVPAAPPKPRATRSRNKSVVEGWKEAFKDDFTIHYDSQENKEALWKALDKLPSTYDATLPLSLYQDFMKVLKEEQELEVTNPKATIEYDGDSYSGGGTIKFLLDAGIRKKGSYSSDGSIERRFKIKLDREGKITKVDLHRDYFRMPSGHKGKGVATKMEKHTVQRMQAITNGLNTKTTVTMSANLDVGGYSWAKLDYKAEYPESAVNSFKSGQRNDDARALYEKMTPEQQTEVEATIEHVKKTGFMLNFAMLGHTDDWPKDASGDHYGKLCLLGMSWEAIKTFHPRRT